METTDMFILYGGVMFAILFVVFLGGGFRKGGGLQVA